ncbi:hypothetical protein MAR_036117 [Mya arenaria]|uniref:Uncharacterized protein n=1 Tax=Mya arenaria TaxID=6604 RepID=A0ABY7EQE3_MYAAR|nr:hypothetical protein MAR_036117 [Mya arenaria]
MDHNRSYFCTTFFSKSTDHYSRIVNTNADFFTYFTESSESITVLICTFKETLIHYSGVADPQRDQNVRHHFPVYGAISVPKPKHSSLYRHIWMSKRQE